MQVNNEMNYLNITHLSTKRNIKKKKSFELLILNYEIVIYPFFLVIIIRFKPTNPDRSSKSHHQIICHDHHEVDPTCHQSFKVTFEPSGPTTKSLSLQIIN